MDWKDVVSNLGSYFRYRFNLLDLERWTANAMIRFKGRSVAAMERESEQLFGEFILPTIYAESLELIEHHRKEGHVVALVSGATRLVTQPLAHPLLPGPLVLWDPAAGVRGLLPITEPRSAPGFLTSAGCRRESL